MEMKLSLPQLVSEALIVLWLLYYLQSFRYLASLNSFKWCVDRENKPGEQRPGGIQGSDCTASSPPFGSGYSGLEGTMEAHTKSLEVCQRASAPEVPLECHLSHSAWCMTVSRTCHQTAEVRSGGDGGGGQCETVPHFCTSTDLIVLLLIANSLHSQGFLANCQQRSSLFSLSLGKNTWYFGCACLVTQHINVLAGMCE